jgi:hypothetical protein
MHRSTYELLLIKAYNALAEMKAGNQPTEHHWGELASAVNTLHALRIRGHILDPENNIDEALAAMRQADGRFRFTGKGLQTIITLLQDYVLCYENLPERTIKSAINFAFDQQLKGKPR